MWNDVLRWLGYCFIVVVCVVIGYFLWNWLYPSKPLKFTQGAPVERGQLKKDVDLEGNKVLRDQDGNIVMTVHQDSAPASATTPVSVQKNPSVKVTEATEGVSDIQFSAKINEGRNLSVSIATDDVAKCVKKGDEKSEVKAEATTEHWSGKTLQRKVRTKSSSVRKAEVERPKPIQVATVAKSAPAPAVAVAPVAVQQKSVAPPCKGDCEGERFVLPAPRDQNR